MVNRLHRPPPGRPYAWNVGARCHREPRGARLIWPRFHELHPILWRLEAQASASYLRRALRFARGCPRLCPDYCSVQGELHAGVRAAPAVFKKCQWQLFYRLNSRSWRFAK